jgi:hypothetical protein
MMNYKKASLVTAMIAVGLITGCASDKGHSQGSSWIPETSDSLTVETTPAGAEVWIMGKREGVSPGTFPASLIFPRQYRQEDIGLYGRVRLVKEGCESMMLPVSTQALASRMKVKLNCAAPAPAPAPIASQPHPVPVASPEAYRAPQVAPASTPAPAAMPSTAKERLLRLEELRRDGLISEEEYQTLRKRVLDTL